MTDVVRVSLPVGPHLGEKVSAKDSLELSGCRFDVIASTGPQVRIVLRVKLFEPRRDRLQRFAFRLVRLVQQRNRLALEIRK